MPGALASPAARISPWDRIDYAVPVPDDFVVPEHHWPVLASLTGLTPQQRIAANHAALSFSCEMFIQCETYVITYLEEKRRRIQGLAKDAAVDRFVAEEREHIEAFYRLLDLLNARAYADRRLKLIPWTVWDRLILWLAPPVSLFAIAALFEEMSLPVPTVMDLHAKEEQFHIHLDERALEALNARLPRWLFALQLCFSLPLMAYIDGVLGRAWRRSMKAFAARQGLTEGARSASWPRCWRTRARGRPRTC